MKNALHLHIQTQQGEASCQQKQQTYSFLETAQVMGVPLSDLRDILKQHELHTEPGPRGERVSRREVFDYVSRHPTRVVKAGRGISI